MTPEQIQQFDLMQKRIADLENIQNLASFTLLIRELEKKGRFIAAKETSGAADTDVDRTVSLNIPSVPYSGSITVFDYPDAFILVTLSGIQYRIPLYLETRF